jgi:hypothetical protein
VDSAEAIAESAGVSVTEHPAAVSTLVELDSPVGAFCLAEVVLTTAAVVVDGEPGWGCVLGYDEEAALAAAICEAAGGHGVEQLARRSLAVEEAARERTRAALLATEVSLR